MADLDEKLDATEATPAETASEYGNPVEDKLAPAEEARVAAALKLGAEQEQAPLDPLFVFEAGPRPQTKKRKRSTREILQDRRYIC